MKKSISKNYIYNMIYQVFILLIPLITTPYISRVLSVEGIGIYSFTYSIATFFALIAELGSFSYARREIAYYQDDEIKRSKLFWETFLLRVITTFFCASIYIIYILNSKYVIIGLIQIIYIFAVVFDITWFYQGMENFGTVVIKNTLVKVLGLIFIFLFVKSEDDLIVYVLGLALILLLGNIVTWSNIFKYIKIIPIQQLKPLKHLKGTIHLFIPNIASQVYLLLDKTMLGFLTVDTIENGYYEQAQKIIRICWSFLTTFSAVMAPRVAFTFINNKSEFKKYIVKSFEIMWLISVLLTCGIIAVTDNAVPWFFGENYIKVIDLLKIFSFILLPIGINSVIGTQYLITVKKHKIYTMSIIVGASLNLLLNCFIIPRYYSIGAAISSVFAEYTITIIQVIYIVYIEKEIRLKDIFDNSWQYVLAGIIMLIVVKNISIFLDANLLCTALLIIVGTILYSVILILFKNKIVLEGFDRIKKSLEKFLYERC